MTDFLYYQPSNCSCGDCRTEGLGTLSVFTDELLFRIFKLLNVVDLRICAMVSRAFYVFADDEVLWKKLCLNRWKGNFLWKGTWKWTAILDKFQPLPFPIIPLRIGNFKSEYLEPLWFRQFIPMNNFSNAPKQIERRSALTLTLEQFIKEFDSVQKPLILTDIVPKWRASHVWSKEQLLLRFPRTRFKTDQVVYSSKGKRKKMKMCLQDYLIYSSNNNDEDPIYLFDPSFSDRAPDLLHDYDVPIYFREDLFSVLGEEKRPYYRWLVIGPKRSGSPFHLDPYRTSAWNALISGRKRWTLYPPDVIPPGVDYEIDSDGESDSDSPEPVKWFLDNYDQPPDRMPLEDIQEPGELIFVPSGWWHMVLNLEDTVAVTQNMCNTQNFNIVYNYLKRDDRKMKRQFKKKLMPSRPDIFVNYYRYQKKMGVYSSSSSSDSSSSSSSSDD